MQYQPTPRQNAAIQRNKDRRRRKRQQREMEYRRRIEQLRRRIEEARKRRQRLLLLLLLALHSMQESILAAFRRSYMNWPDPILASSDWTPDPAQDYAPESGHDDHCDGYSRDDWNRMLSERGITLSRKAELRKAWVADPHYGLFPVRYQEWGSKPFLGQIIEELATPYWRSDAFAALKLLSPPETHTYLAEAYATDPGNLRQCLADRDSDILQAIQTRSALWEERKRKEAEEQRKAKNTKKPDDDEKKFEP